LYPSSTVEPIIAPVGGILRLNIGVVSEGEPQIDARVIILCDRSVSDQNFACDVKITQDPRIVTAELKLPEKTGFHLKPLEITLINSQDLVLHRERTNPLKIVTYDRYFEHLVRQNLEILGFETEWLSERDPGNPDIRAYFRLYPKEIFDVECTTENIYDVNKLYTDYAKFIAEREEYGFTRLLIVPLTLNIVGGVPDKIREYHESITLIRYADLLQLVEQRRVGIMSKEETYIHLTQRGEVPSFPMKYYVDPVPKKQVALEFLYRF